MKIDARFFPLALHGPFGDIFHGRDFLKRKAAKELQVHHFRQRRLRLREFIKRVADPSELFAVHGIFNVGSQRRNLELAAALLSLTAASMIDNQASHDASGITHESVAIRKGGSVLSGDLDICLVQESGSAEGHVRAVSRQFVLSKSVQFCVKRAKQCVGSRSAAAFGRFHERK
jgi:hypothetical protein